MWFDESPAQRVSCLRAQEALATGARTLATACPFCLNMMTDGMAGTQGGEKAKVLDIAELLLSRRTPSSAEVWSLPARAKSES
jgi:Fe-S oxidoreductase